MWQDGLPRCSPSRPRAVSRRVCSSHRNSPCGCLSTCPTQPQSIPAVAAAAAGCTPCPTLSWSTSRLMARRRAIPKIRARVAARAGSSTHQIQRTLQYFGSLRVHTVFGHAQFLWIIQMNALLAMWHVHRSPRPRHAFAALRGVVGCGDALQVWTVLSARSPSRVSAASPRSQGSP